MSKKSAKIASLIEECEGQPLPAHYLGYFRCFNQGLYYEAHDVLEELWLTQRGQANDGFFKGLIQFAGAFVHLQKNRLQPAAALLRLCQTYLVAYLPHHEHLDVGALMLLASAWISHLEAGEFRVNPLTNHAAPTLALDFIQPGPQPLSMASTPAPVTLTTQQIEELARTLSTLRHDINNHLSLVVAATELIRVNPASVPRMVPTLAEQPEKINGLINTFTLEIERLLGIKRG